ncbi:hypothetical protein Tco_1213952 [Tanacetum coccineum]
MHHSMCSSTSNLVFMTLVLSFWAIPLVSYSYGPDGLLCYTCGIWEDMDHQVKFIKEQWLVTPVYFSLVPSAVPLKILDARLLCYLLSDLSFFGGGDDEGSAAANSVMHVSADGDCGVQQKGLPELDAPPPPRPPHPSQHHHHRCHHQMTHYHNCLIHRQDGQQDPPQGPPYPLPD